MKPTARLVLFFAISGGVFQGCHSSEVIPLDQLPGGNPNDANDSDDENDDEPDFLVPGCEEDSWETGDAPGAAPLILYSEEISGVICTTERCSADFSGATDECDFFRMDTLPLTQLQVSLTFSHDEGDLDVGVWDAWGNLIGVSEGMTDIEQIDDVLVLEGGEIYVGVCGWNCASNDYVLRVDPLDPYEAAQEDSDDDCRNDVSWGATGAWRRGFEVENWALEGYVDQDRDGIAEIENVSFTLEDIHCAGYASAVVLFGDTACPSCEATFKAVAEVQAQLAQNNAAILLLYGDGWKSGSVEVAYDEVSGYGFEGQYITGVIPAVPVVLYPDIAILDIRAGRLIADNILTLEQLLGVTDELNRLYP